MPSVCHFIYETARVADDIDGERGPGARPLRKPAIVVGMPRRKGRASVLPDARVRAERDDALDIGARSPRESRGRSRSGPGAVRGDAKAEHVGSQRQQAARFGKPASFDGNIGAVVLNLPDGVHREQRERKTERDGQQDAQKHEPQRLLRAGRLLAANLHVPIVDRTDRPGEVGGSHDQSRRLLAYAPGASKKASMNDSHYVAALAAAGQVAASYATARPAVTSDEHIKSIVRVFDAIFDAAIAKSTS
jgi:hypothetical protein